MDENAVLAVIEAMRARRDDDLQRLFELLRIPSISTQTDHNGDCQAAAEWLLRQLGNSGFKTELIATAQQGHPLVWGEWLEAGPDVPTVLFYGHYDVQPVEGSKPWLHGPFDPQVDGDYIYARGASDDKGQVAMHLFAWEAYMRIHGKLPINIKILLEGEEESGGKGIAAFLKDPANQARLRADFLLVSDTSMPNPETPCICRGLRGIAYFKELRVLGPSGDQHSGMVGGAVYNPMIALCHLIGRLITPTGEILVPGFSDRVREIDPAEAARLEAFPLPVSEFTGQTGAPLWGCPGFSLQARVGALPTLDLHGIWGGYSGEGSKTVIPAEVACKISMRLVPDQDPAEIASLFETFVRQQAQELGVRVELSGHHLAKPLLVDVDSPPIQAASRALRRVWGVEPVFERSGGSIPVVELFKTELGLDPVLMGFGLPGDCIHAPNERFHLGNFNRGGEAIVWALDEFSRMNS